MPPPRLPAKKFTAAFGILVIAFLLFVKRYLLNETLYDHQSNQSDKENSFSFDLNEKKADFLGDSDRHLMWFVQISDLHLSQFHDKGRIDDFELFCSQVLQLIKPRVVLASGDLTDAKNADLTGSRQYEYEWREYQRVLQDNKQMLSSTLWLDVRGNHDNFDVVSRDSHQNLFKRYGMQGAKSHASYMQRVRTWDGDVYSFIAVDASIEPGPRRPFNFFGYLDPDDRARLAQFNQQAGGGGGGGGGGTIWFGHFPSSTIYGSSRFRSIMTNGVAYLSGHFHNFAGLTKQMYTRNHLTACSS
jgi:3',5'-cyclic AMP phosphodiesterase CpdA